MSIFISHSFEDKDQFENVADALAAAGLAFWKPGDILPGALLSEQLREAIKRSDLCIFIATAKSLKSPWCAAELGAFWGADKGVFIYVADSSVRENSLPQQFKGHVFERRLTKLVEAIKSRSAAVVGDASPVPTANSSSSGEATESLLNAIEAALDRANMRHLAAMSVKEIADTISALPPRSMDVAEPILRSIRQLLSGLLGLPWGAVQHYLRRFWPEQVESPIKTSNGLWHGYALDAAYDSVDYCDQYWCCLLLKVDDERSRIAAVALVPHLVDSVTGGKGIVHIATPWSIVGLGKIGDLVKNSDAARASAA